MEDSRLIPPVGTPIYELSLKVCEAVPFAAFWKSVEEFNKKKPKKNRNKKVFVVNMVYN